MLSKYVKGKEREGKGNEMCKLKENSDTARNGYKLAMNIFKLKVLKTFLTI